MNRYKDKTFQQFYAELFDKIKLKIASEKDDFIVAQATEDLVKYYSQELLQPIEFDLERDESLEHQKYMKTIYEKQREWGFQNEGDLRLECERVIVKIPILPNRDISQILSLRTNTITLSATPEFEINGSNVVIEVETKGYGFNLQNEQISEKVFTAKNFVTNDFFQRILESMFKT